MTLPNLSALNHEDVESTGVWTWVDQGGPFTRDMFESRAWVEGDGDCLYHCFIGIIGQDHYMSAFDMRLRIAEYIGDHRDYFVDVWSAEMREHLRKEGLLRDWREESIENGNSILDEYLLQAVENQGHGLLTYGSEIEIDAFALRYNLQVDLYQHQSKNVFDARLVRQFSHAKDPLGRPARQFPNMYPDNSFPHWVILQTNDHFDYVRRPYIPPDQPDAGLQEAPAQLHNFKELRRLKNQNQALKHEDVKKQQEQDLRERSQRLRNRDQNLNNRMASLDLGKPENKKAAVPASWEKPRRKRLSWMDESSDEEENEAERRMRLDMEAARRLQEEEDDADYVRQMEFEEAQREWGGRW